MIRYIYVIKKPSGLPLFSVSYVCGYGIRCDELSQDSLDPALFSGFISALFTVGETLGGELQRIVFKELDIYTYTTQEIIGVLITDLTENPNEMKERENRARLLTELFLNTYKNLLKSSLVTPRQYNGFQGIIEEAGIIDPSARFKKNCHNCVYDKACPFRILTGNPLASLKERIQRIPRHSFWKRMTQLIRAMRIYRPITEDAKEPNFSILTVTVYNKSTKHVYLGGYGCNNFPQHQATTQEIEMVTATISAILKNKAVMEKTIVQFPFKFEKIAHALLNLPSWLVLLEIEYHDKELAKRLSIETLDIFEDFLDSFDGELPTSEDLQQLDPDRFIALCSKCDTVTPCLNKTLLDVFRG